MDSAVVAPQFNSPLEEQIEKLKQENEMLLDKLYEAVTTKRNDGNDILVSKLEEELRQTKEQLINITTELEMAPQGVISQHRQQQIDVIEKNHENMPHPYLSLCCVGKSSGSSVELLRLADIVNGMIQIQRQNDAPNRDTLYTQSCTKSEGFIGVWNWRLDYNFRSGRENYVISSYERDLDPADMKSLSETSTPDSDILFGVLPYAYVTGKFEVICEELQKGSSLSKEAKELLKALGGDLA